MSVTDLDIERWVELRYGFVPHPYWIAHCKELYLLRVEKPERPRKPWHECPPEKRLIIKEAFAHFGLLEDKEAAVAMVGGAWNRHRPLPQPRKLLAGAPSTREWRERMAMPQGKISSQEAALLISPVEEDHAIFNALFQRNGWTLHGTSSLNSASALLREESTSVVITERDLPDGDWKDVLVATHILRKPPLLIVISRQADDYLWAWGFRRS